MKDRADRADRADMKDRADRADREDMEDKKFRFVSVDGCKLIGQGKHGKVYQLNDEQIIKVYYDRSSLELIERERILSRRAFVLGVPTAITFGTVETELGYGVIYESAGIMPLGTYMESHPESFDEYAAKFADILISLNSIEADTTVFGSVHDWYMERISSISRKYLSKKNIDALIRIVKAIPVKTNFLHTDFHTQNVMIDKNGELLVIDMADVGYGNPIFDIGGTYMTMCQMPKTDAKSCREVTGLSADNCIKLWNILVRKYFKTEDEQKIKEYEKMCSFLSDLRMAIVLSFSIDLAEFKRYIIAFIEKWKVIRLEKEYIAMLGRDDTFFSA